MEDSQNKHKNYLATLLLPQDSFDLTSSQLMGRRIAGVNLVKGITQNLKQNEQLNIFTDNTLAKHNLENLLYNLKPKESNINIKTKLSNNDLQTLFIQDTSITKYSALRAGIKSNAFSIVGMIHTLSSTEAIQSIQNTVTGPLEDWDALICTSTTGKKVVERIINYHHHSLEEKFGIILPKNKSIKLPIIPLAVKDFLIDKNITRQEKRINARNILGLPKDSYVILYLGRLCSHAKAHPSSIYQAVSKTASLCTDKKIILLECGVFNNKLAEEAYNDLARNTNNLNLIRIGGSKNATEDEKELALMAADVFVSPSDNIQETFGITVVEAMSAELPIIISDWNGYKDFVLDGENGYLIPTSYYLGADNSLDFIDREYQLGLINYDYMIGLRSMTTCLDANVMAERLIYLANNPQKRIEIGLNSKKHWRTKFSWEIVQKKLRDLWEELYFERLKAVIEKKQRSNIPSMKYLFKDYGTNEIKIKNSRYKISSKNPEILKHKLHISLSKIIIGKSIYTLIDYLNDNKFLDIQDLTKIGIPNEKKQLIISSLMKFSIIESDNNY